VSTTPSAYLTGLLAGTRAKEAGITESVLDIGRQVPVNGSKVFAALQGVLDAGISCPHNENMIPQDDRINGTHLDASIAKDVERIKEKIIGGS
jgi:large subunit ribosomal protein L18